MSRSYDALVVGSGPNGLAAAITLQRCGLSVLVLEARSSIGGGMRTQELTLPGFKHDVCSAVHPLLKSSPFFQTLPLAEYGLEFIHPPVPLAHPLEGETSALLSHSMENTATDLGADQAAYRKLLQPMLRDWTAEAKRFLSPLDIHPSNIFDLSKFAWHALRSAEVIAGNFQTEKAKGLWAGLAGHAMLPFEQRMTGASALILAGAAHAVGWPIVKGGSGCIAKAMGSYFQDLGGVIETNVEVNHIQDLPPYKALLFDLGPRQILDIMGSSFPLQYQRSLRKYRYGMGVFKIDWALQEAVPFRDPGCRQAGTLHLGGTFAEIARAEQQTFRGQHVSNPFVLFAQPSLFDPTRAPENKHVAWAYCHVPHGSSRDMTQAIEAQVERFAPGFKACIIERHTYNARQMQAYNPNYIGGDINGGIMDLKQLFFRPVPSLSPYRTARKGVYICSASTPPGGGVHGMCGYHAAKTALKDIFRITL